MDIHEEAVLNYLTHGGKIFVCPEFQIEKEGFVPDFLALNFEENPTRLEIIEVSSANEPSELVGKVKRYQGNEKQVMSQLVAHLPELRKLGITESTPLFIRVFIKREKINGFRNQLNDRILINSLDGVFETLLDFRKRKLDSEG